VVSEERDKQLGASVLENESKISVTAAFEQLVTQFVDAKTAVHMRLAKMID
jgi:hypothetical protein